MNRKNEEFTPTANEIAALFRQFGQFAYENSLVAQTKFSELYQSHVKSHLDKEIHRFIYDIVNWEIASDQLAEGLKAGLFLAYLELKKLLIKILPDKPFAGSTFVYFLENHFFKILSFYFVELEENDFKLPRPPEYPTRNLYANWCLIWVVMDKNIKKNVKYTGDYHLFFQEIKLFYSEFESKLFTRRYLKEIRRHRTWGRKDIKITKEIIIETKSRMDKNPYKKPSPIMKEVCLINKLSGNTLIKWWSNNYRLIIPYHIKRKYYGKEQLPKALKVFERLTKKELLICYKNYKTQRGIYCNNCI